MASFIQFKTTLVLFALAACVMALSFPANIAIAQNTIEPEIRTKSLPQSALDFDLRNGATFNLNVTNYGFSISGQYRRVLARNTEWVSEGGLGTLKDSREQTFFFFGQQLIPNKFQRVFNFPVMTGVRHRILANYIDDNFRVFLTGKGGVAFSFAYPYFEDRDAPDGLPAQVQLPDSRIYDVFQGWSDGSWKTGYSGKFSATIDFGTSFSTLTALEFGVMAQYYPQGIQIMEPNRLEVTQQGASVIRGEGFDAQTLFLTPTITLMFGGMW